MQSLGVHTLVNVLIKRQKTLALNVFETINVAFLFVIRKTEIY